MAGERGWIPMTINFVPPRIINSHWEAVEQGARRVGKKADRSTWRIAREIFVADTTEEARKAVMEGTIARDFRDYFFNSLTRYKLFDVFKIDPDMPDSDVTLDYLLDNIWIVGSPDDVAEQVRRLYDDVGGFGILLAMAHEWEPRDQWLHSMTLLKNEVMPRLSDLD
jgi:alkanesulfonate monooxygenase SsuD/methylene tetrahydromethanopterin reductase-like flavin-dependent oxidoreductase (luciferase family)